MRQLRTRPLTLEKISQAFPLIQAAFPEITLNAWRQFAEDRLLLEAPAQGGILTVLCEQRYIAGLCSYRLEADLLHGQALAVDLFVAYDMFDREAIANALVSGLETIARTNNCRATHTQLIERRRNSIKTGLLAMLTRSGHKLERIRRWKHLRLSV